MEQLDRCPFCSSQDLVEGGFGKTVCGSCGEVIEERAMISEVTFLERANGAVTTSHGRVNMDTVNPFTPGMSYTNHELCIQRGMDKIEFISSRLQINREIKEAARRMYQLSVHMNFNVGRPTRLVASACLYMVCRRERKPYLLIDFADVLATPVKTVGKFYIKLLKRLVGGDPSHQAAIANGIRVPIIDPSVFLERFASKLPYGDAQQQIKVQNTAMQIIKFMHRDWICVGRRPNGLCGSALLVAGHFHGCQVAASDIAEVVRMSEGTLKLRLQEMRHTRLAIMSKEQFEQILKTAAIEDLDKLGVEDKLRAYPPCFLRRNPHLQAQMAKAAILDRESDKLAIADNAALPSPAVNGKKQAKVFPPVPRVCTTGNSDTGARGDTIASTHRDSDAEFTTPEKSSSRIEKFTTLVPSGDCIQDIVKDIVNDLAPNEAVSSDPLDAAAAVVRNVNAKKVAGDERSEPGSPRSVAASSTDLKEESLSDVEDEELEAYLLDEDEQAHKAAIWHEVNKDYLEEWHVRSQDASRRKKKAEDSASDTGSRATSGTGSRKSRRLFQPATSVTQSAIMALTKKGKVGADRINIEALESLFDD